MLALVVAAWSCSHPLLVVAVVVLVLAGLVVVVVVVGRAATVQTVAQLAGAF